MAMPWEDVPHVWPTERAYLNWLRSQVRRTWSRHPIKTSYIRAREVPVKDLAGMPDEKLGVAKLHPSTKVVCSCEMCTLWFPKGKMEIDHIKGGEGFSDYEGFLEWQHRMLFVGYDDIRHLCKECHQLVTLSQRFKCTLEEAPKYQELAAFKKLKAPAQSRKLNNLALGDGKNGKERIAIYQAYLEIHT